MAQGNTTGGFSEFINTDFIFVTSVSDLPTAIGGVITLSDNITYYICTTVDLSGSRIVAGQNTTILGASSENCRLKSTGLGATALITSNWSLPMRNITIEATLAINLDATGNSNQALDWFGVNFTDCATVGTIKGYNNFIMTDSAFLNSQGLTFDGTLNTIGFLQCLFDNRTSGTSIIIPSTATIARRFRVNYSSFASLTGETALNVSTSASIPIEGYFLDTVNFSGGGTYLSGVQYNDNKTAFTNCRGIGNSAQVSQYYMINNVTVTTILAPNTFVKILGTTTSGNYVQKFTNTNNRATYTGATGGFFKVSVTASANAGNNQTIATRIAKNGVTSTASENQATTSGVGRSENIKCQDILELATNDYVEVYISNNSATTSITVTELSLIIEKLN